MRWQESQLICTRKPFILKYFEWSLVVTDCGSEGDDFIMTELLSLVIISLWKKHGPSFEDIGIYFIIYLRLIYANFFYIFPKWVSF